VAPTPTSPESATNTDPADPAQADARPPAPLTKPNDKAIQASLDKITELMDADQYLEADQALQVLEAQLDDLSEPMQSKVTSMRALLKAGKRPVTDEERKAAAEPPAPKANE
jgi:hypothetical protein